MGRLGCFSTPTWWVFSGPMSIRLPRHSQLFGKARRKMDETSNMDADPTANISDSEVMIPDHSVSKSASVEEFPESQHNESSGDGHDAPESKDVDDLRPEVDEENDRKDESTVNPQDDRSVHSHRSNRSASRRRSRSRSPSEERKRNSNNNQRKSSQKRVDFDITNMTYEQYCAEHYARAIDAYRRSRFEQEMATMNSQQPPSGGRQMMGGMGMMPPRGMPPGPMPPSMGYPGMPYPGYGMPMAPPGPRPPYGVPPPPSSNR